MNKSWLFPAIFGLVPLGLPAQEAEPVGIVLAASGSVTATELDGDVRALQRRSALYEGDTITTDTQSRVQFRFNDDGRVALQPDSSFFIETHRFSGQEDGSEQASYELIRGGLQAITGLIGHTNKERYNVNTPLANIGLRGTHWTATYCDSSCEGNPPGLYGGVADGGIDVCNSAGCTAIDADNYFYTPNISTLTQTLLAPPSVVFMDSPDAEGDPEPADEGDNQAPENNSGGNDGNSANAGANAVNATNAGNSSNATTPPNTPVAEQAPSSTTAFNPRAGNGNASPNASALANASFFAAVGRNITDDASTTAPLVSETSDTISELSDEDIEGLGNSGNGQGQGNSNNNGSPGSGNSGGNSNPGGNSNSGNTGGSGSDNGNSNAGGNNNSNSGGNAGNGGSNTVSGSGGPSGGNTSSGGGNSNSNPGNGNAGNSNGNSNAGDGDTSGSGNGNSNAGGNGNSNSGGNPGNGNSGDSSGNGSDTPVDSCAPICDLIAQFGENVEYESNLEDAQRRFDAFWGRWGGPNSKGNQLDDHFAYSPDATESLPGSGSVGYQLLSATAPTDQTGKQGVVSNIEMLVNFDTQKIQSLNLDLETGTSHWIMANTTAADLGSGSAISVDLLGTCSLACAKRFESIEAFGTSVITLVGPNADGALGTYDLNAGSATAHGAFILEAAP